MEIEELIKPGLRAEESFLVEEIHMAENTGSGSLKVLATPWMIAFMENVSYRLLEKYLPLGVSSVGILVKVQHLAPTPIGGELRVQCEVIEISNREITLKVKAWDDYELVGEGRHTRVIIDEERFLRRVIAKTPKLAE